MLISTAILKLWSLATDPFADLNAELTREVIVAAIMVELTVGYLNFRHLNQHRVALMNVILFLFLGAFSISKWYLGSSSCACAGVFRLPIWIFITIDFAFATLFFLLFRLDQLPRTEFGLSQIWRTIARRASPGTMVALVLFTVFLVWLQFPSSASFRATLFGEQLIKAYLSVPERLQVAETSIGEVEIHNKSATDAKIVGMDVSCRCFELDEPIGLVLAANSIRKIDFRIIPSKQGEVHQRAVLFLDHPEQFRMSIDLLGFAKE